MRCSIQTGARPKGRQAHVRRRVALPGAFCFGTMPLRKREGEGENPCSRAFPTSSPAFSTSSRGAARFPRPTSPRRCARCAGPCSTSTWRSTWSRSFTDKVQARAVGANVVKSVSPGQMVIKIVNDVLVETLGRQSRTDRSGSPPAGDHHDGRLAGRRQDHDDRQARQAPQGAREKAGADGLARCEAARRAGAARDFRPAGWRRHAGDRPEPDAIADHPASDGGGEISRATTSCCSTRPAAPISTNR